MRDASRALFAAGAIAIVSRGDAHFSAEASRNQSSFAHDLARAGEHIGNGAYSLPVLGGLWAYGHFAHRPALRGAAIRIAGGAVTSLVAVGGLKELVGRWRPDESPDDPYRYKAFSSHSSFPSGHTAWAFALAAGVDRETSARWIPYVAYPLAGVTAWSRVHDRKHWASDVTAAAIVGVWAEHRFAVVVPRASGGAPSRLGIGIGEAPGGAGIGPVATIAF